MKKKELTKKVKKKRWYPVVAPRLFREMLLGESYLPDPALLEGKFLTLNLMNLTGDAKRQNINIGFIVDKVTDGKGFAKVINYSMIPSSLKRIVRRGKDKVSDSFLARTKDKVYVRLKPLLITTSKTPKSVQQKMRAETRKFIRAALSEKNYDDLVPEIVGWRLQKSLKETLTKIHPLRSVELRYFGTVKLNLYGMDEEEVDLDKAEEKIVEKEITKEEEPTQTETAPDIDKEAPSAPEKETSSETQTPLQDTPQEEKLQTE